MPEVAATPMVALSHNGFLLRAGSQFSGENWKLKKLPCGSSKLLFCVPNATKPGQSMMTITNYMDQPSSYSSSIGTDIPLYETPGASFDLYLEDKPRVFKAMFPDKRRSQQLNQDEWRIQMLPIHFLFLTAWPIIDMRLRCKTKGIEYPPGVPPDITKVLELDIIRWKLQGLEDILKPSHFTLGVKGALYPDRNGMRSRLKGQLQLDITFVLPSVLALVPEEVRQDVAQSVLKTLVENMKQKVNSSLLADYNEFKRERSKNLV